MRIKTNLALSNNFVYILVAERNALNLHNV